MATIPYFVLSPSAFACIIALLRGPDKITPTPAENWRTATVDLVIPAYNEELNIPFALNSIKNQTLKPNNIFIVDDGSTDKTSHHAELFSKNTGMTNVKIIRKEKSEGKTPALSQMAHESVADVLFVLDADTVLSSNNYIECLVQELYQGTGIASACGLILPGYERDRRTMLNSPVMNQFSNLVPEIKKPKDNSWWKRLQRNLTNYYREEIYLFLEKFIYHGETVFCGSLINPIGCAVAYKRKYILEVFDHFEDLLGHDLTTSEDIFIGFAFAEKGYKNALVDSVNALTEEPLLSKLPRQMLMWSSAFFQSCYYFTDLVTTPLKYPRYLFHRFKIKRALKNGEIKEKRVIKESYRQGFGIDITKKYGRPIGWFIFTALLEKITFPIIVLLMLIFNLWFPLLITVIAEVLLFSVLIALMYKPHRMMNLLKSILIAPIRYTFLLFDIFVMGVFIKDLFFSKTRKWKK